MIRLRQMGENHKGAYSMVVNAFEIYGDYKLEEVK
jgi:ribosomal protein S16